MEILSGDIRVGGSKMTLKDVLKHKSAAGKPYFCDIEQWLGVELPCRQLCELQDLLAEVQDVR